MTVLVCSNLFFLSKIGGEEYNELSERTVLFTLPLNWQNLKGVIVTSGGDSEDKSPWHITDKNLKCILAIAFTIKYIHTY